MFFWFETILLVTIWTIVNADAIAGGSSADMLQLQRAYFDAHQAYHEALIQQPGPRVRVPLTAPSFGSPIKQTHRRNVLESHVPIRPTTSIRAGKITLGSTSISANSSTDGSLQIHSVITDFSGELIAPTMNASILNADVLKVGGVDIMSLLEDILGYTPTAETEFQGLPDPIAMMDPTVYWDFNEGSGFYVVDRVSGEEYATRIGASWVPTNISVDSVSGYSLSFDGENDYMLLQYATWPNSLDFGRISFSAWLKAPVYTGDWHTQAFLIDAVGWSLQLSSWSLNNWIFSIGDKTCDSENVPQLQDGIWHFHVWTLDQEHQSGWLYIDGLPYSFQSTDCLGESSEPTSEVYVACQNTGDFRYEGVLDDFQVFNGTVLSLADVATMYEAYGYNL